ncbi:hypothetical protein B7P43_G14470 [Cryptotermes secundus]|uniref:RRM domain-containing protein n=2 Tax=Cryptotermes secundus TaxID=105785 RepID=A0A2J7RR38_9NEOP|nr:RNA-binding protein 33 isoform X2 [Cryptotermes secundus]PNF43287.1 hypothetical protein B7P43_G14470 [Cryptotermes secundus]
MSDNNDDTLLEGDIGDDVDYDLGNEDEDALLADDYDVQGSSHRTVYLGEQDVLGSRDGYRREPDEPFDDVLDLGVTEGDDLDSELQESQEPEKLRHMKDSNLLHRVEQQQGELMGTAHISQETGYVEGQEISVTQGVPGVESEEEEEDAEESRGDRFKTERTTIVSLKTPNKSYGNIPDSLDNVCVEDGKQMVRRDGAWRGGRRGRGVFIGRGAGGGPRPQFIGNFSVHPLQQQQQGFAGPRFGVDGFVRPTGRPGARGGIYSRPQLSQQQPPHKILINPHFRGAVQPHPEARLIWDPEMPPNQTLQSQPQPPPPYQPLETAYQITPPGSGYTVQQFQPPPPQHDPHPLAPPLRYDSPSQQRDYFPPEQSYTQEQPTVPHWQDNCDPLQQGGSDMYAQPSHVPPGMESDMRHPNHSMGEPSMNYGQPVYGTGMEQYETVLPQQQQGVFHEMLPPQQHYHPLPPPVSSASHHMPPPMVGMYRLPTPSSVLGPVKFRQPSPVPYRHPAGPGYMNQGGRPSAMAPRFPPGIQMNVPQQLQMIRPRPQPSIPVHQQKSNRTPKKRSSFEAGGGGSAQFKQLRFDAATKRKKRMPDMSNLHEVQTVDMLPPDMNSQLQQPVEEEDEETREYRKKIEQQKLEREKFLQRKEERRKLAALEKQRELQKKDVDVMPGGDGSQSLSDPPQGNAIATIVNRNTVEPQPAIYHPVIRHVMPQQQAHQKLQQSTKIRASVQQQQQFHQDVRPSQAPAMLASVGGVWQVRGKRGRGTVRGCSVGRGQQGVLHQPQLVSVPPSQQEMKREPTAKVAVPGQRIVRAPQPGTVANQPPVMPRRLVLTQSAGRQVTPVPRQVMPQAPKGRTVVLRGANSGTKPVQQQQQQQQQQRVVAQQQGAPSRQAGGGRSVVATKVMTPQQPEAAAQQPAVPRTKTVSIENLAASTTEQQLKSLCQGIGVLENIQMLPKQRCAILRFTNPTSAATFYKRYQRKIIDLSLITVSLIPQ